MLAPVYGDAEVIQHFASQHQDDPLFGDAWIDIEPPDGHNPQIRVLTGFAHQEIIMLQEQLAGELTIYEGGASAGELGALVHMIEDAAPAVEYGIDRPRGLVRLYPPVGDLPRAVADSQFIVLESQPQPDQGE